MNEAETRAELIDPQLVACGWGVAEGSRILRERDVCKITDGRIQVGGGREKPLIADYILVYKGIKLAVIEAKSNELRTSEGVAQAKLYAQKLGLDYTYSTNGKSIYQICLKTGEEKTVTNFLTPDELWSEIYSDQNDWREKFASIPFEDKSGSWQLRYYQEIAINRTLEAIAQNKHRLLLTLATGTGKTAIAFQIAWKLFYSRWTLSRDGKRQPRILFLTDRNILANQAFSSFSAFAEDAMVRITPKEIKKTDNVPTNGSLFFTIFQSLTANDNTAEEMEIERSDNQDYDKKTAYYNKYQKDFFDLIVIDECHRGGANDESSWRGILEYFSPAVQLGLTATPKRNKNIDTYQYFGDPVYIYSLKEGINDGFLTPFKVKRINTTIDDYTYTSEDKVLEGQVEYDKNYEEGDFNKNIEIDEREKKRIEIFMQHINQDEKTLVFCATQEHAGLVRELINEVSDSTNVNYCVRVTANDKAIGDNFLSQFQDNEKTIPTILTTSKKLSTGVDARNIRNIVLMRPINQMIEFKQIIGRGTRLFEGKAFFTVYDFVKAYQKFFDPEWDGELIELESQDSREIKDCQKCEGNPCVCIKEPQGENPQKIKIKLGDGKERAIQFMIATSFWDASGKPISTEEFLHSLFEELPNFFKDEEELQILWGNPNTRKTLLEKLSEAGFGGDELNTLKRIINAEKSDLYDVLSYVFNGDTKPITREERVMQAKTDILMSLNERQQEFIKFVLEKYIETGVEELEKEKLPLLLKNKYQSVEDAKMVLGDEENITRLFINFQKYLYQSKAA
ncbi:Type I restriction-modification system, restriction subunit R (EC [Bathymodiolus azoricus thioautotrophic gill symbiont]|uniref:Type I restriction-modification system, restriction subunit R (EC) n=1 Tax=Bathymodiolus azoricus thioautotrophic gill symbiont TaxID=235205 RepID=A0ACA8ZTT5_9GAMM|nr:type I restriction endonuclease subunit R [Bathymodiolus azoricus thioautotrophic gill symbiont]CAB5507479.1 Type I restriction-modification system, restriction subunit R (EC [Bathymodiolus azoricus thioautotrophic gill symbiont]